MCDRVQKKELIPNVIEEAYRALDEEPHHAEAAGSGQCEKCGGSMAPICVQSYPKKPSHFPSDVQCQELLCVL